MPKAYEKIRDHLMDEGESRKEAEGYAARIYNSRRKEGQKPVTRDYDKRKSGITQIEVLDGNGKTVGIRPGN